MADGQFCKVGVNESFWSWRARVRERDLEGENESERCFVTLKERVRAR